jgi:hypothetical protein
MKRQTPGLQREGQNGEEFLEGIFLVRVDRAFYRWHPQRPFYIVRFVILEPKKHRDQSIAGRIYCTPKALWKLSWFLRDFGYDPDLMGREEVDEKALLGLRGVLRTSRTILNGRSFLNLDGFAPAADWDEQPSSPLAIPRFLSICVARGAIATGISMAGGKRTTEHRCYSVAASRRRWRPSSRVRIALPHCSKSGEPTSKLRWSIRRETTGSGCSGRGYSYLRGWRKTTESVSASRIATCRSS